MEGHTRFRWGLRFSGGSRGGHRAAIAGGVVGANHRDEGAADHIQEDLWRHDHHLVSLLQHAASHAEPCVPTLDRWIGH
eukprot:5245965-Pyramimonas_sp.AAC.1